MKRLSAVALVGLAACGGGGAPDEAPRAGVVAVYRGGELSFAELEALVPSARTPACVEARQVEGGGSADQLLSCFEEIARTRAFENLVLAGIPDRELAIEGLGETYAELRQHAYFQAWSAALSDELAVDDDDIEAYFDEHRGDFRRLRQFTVWNIFRRHEDPRDQEATVAFLRELKRRCEGGETFSALAREYSHSESRLRDGLVGRMTDDRLPPRLRGIAAGLNEGEVSEPILVAGGAVLLSVTEVVEGEQPGLDEVREQVRRQVLAEKIEARLKTRTAAVELPAEAVILDENELRAALGGADPDRVVLDISGDTVSVAELRRAIGVETEEDAADLDDDAWQSLLEAYRAAVERQLLVVDLLASHDPADLEVQERAESRLGEIADSRLVEKRLHDEMQILLDRREADLRRYFADNRPHYQTELAFDLEVWDLPFDDDPPAQLLAMEELCASGMTLRAAAGRLGGEVEDLGWRDFSGLRFLPNKARSYLLQAPVGGFSVPFQQDNALHVIHVVARREPAYLDYDEVVDDVHADYLERFAQPLAQEVINERLAAGGFKFLTAECRAQLLAE